MSHDPQSPSDAADYDDEPDDIVDENLKTSLSAGAWLNGKFDYYHCRLAGTEDCDWDCPYSAAVRRRDQ